MNTCIVRNVKTFEVREQLKSGAPGRLINIFPSESDARTFAADRREAAGVAAVDPLTVKPIQ